jgi:hypothetical protein
LTGTPLTAAARALPALVKKSTSPASAVRSDRDLAADAEHFYIDAFLFEVTFLLRDDEGKYGRVHRRIGDAEIVDSL